MCAYLNHLGVHHTMYQPLGVDTEVSGRAARHDLRERLVWHLIRPVCWCMPALRPAKQNLPGPCCTAFARLRTPLSCLMKSVGTAKARPPAALSPYCGTSRDSGRAPAQWFALPDCPSLHRRTKENLRAVIYSEVAMRVASGPVRRGAVPCPVPFPEFV